MARKATPEERALWRNAMRGVVEVSGAAAEVPEPPPPPAPRGKGAPAPKSEPPGAGLDRRSALRLKRGELAIEGRLDLHGMTQDEAHRALTRFLEASAETGLRAVLVITGKGGREGPGVLRRAVPRWLAEAGARARVLASSPAQPRHGGDGALYVLLRRKR